MKLFALSLILFALTIPTLFAQGYQIGDKASSFSLRNVDGKQVSPGDYPDAKGFTVIFTCNHCPYAIAYQDRIIELDKKYRELGYPVIAINPNDPELAPEDSFDKMAVRAREKNFTFPYLFDETQEVYRKFGAKRTPHVYVLQKESADLVVRYIGAIDDNYQDALKVTAHYLADALDALIAGNKPDPDFTKAIGCSIKDKQAVK
ncbi:MAG TPA: thioredoxin family protein [Bacteroidales bacterium]|nr:thioredoxin family protein [Bacteroidales bacterium]